MRQLSSICLIVAACLWPSPTVAQSDEIRIIDGDGFAMPDGEIIRVDNIETPSVGDKAHCLSERELGDKAVARVKELFTECPPRLDRRYRDRNGRTAALVEVCGKDLGEVLISEGLATIRGVPPVWCDGERP